MRTLQIISYSIYEDIVPRPMQDKWNDVDDYYHIDLLMPWLLTSPNDQQICYWLSSHAPI